MHGVANLSCIFSGNKLLLTISPANLKLALFLALIFRFNHYTAPQHRKAGCSLSVKKKIIGAIHLSHNLQLQQVLLEKNHQQTVCWQRSAYVIRDQT